MEERLFTTSIQLLPSKSDRLDKIAFDKKISKAKLIRDILDDYIEKESSKK